MDSSVIASDFKASAKAGDPPSSTDPFGVTYRTMAILSRFLILLCGEFVLASLFCFSFLLVISDRGRSYLRMWRGFSCAAEGCIVFTFLDCRFGLL